MYPNPQDVLPLPPRPDLEQYRRRAKDLVKACRSGAEAVQAWSDRWVDTVLGLHPDLPRWTLRDTGPRKREIAEYARTRLAAAECHLSQAQLVIARAHGFASWTKLVRHLEALADRASAVSAFERAADAVVSGDLESLERLLAAQPDLARARSSREHRATLLHYTSANGVENYRQKTPANIVPIARTLLDAGAAVDAEADVYGGGATTLGLTVTSAHPRLMGVQNDLADLLLGRGARLHPRTVRDCLANGCPEAAAHMAERGAPLGLPEAAGIGRLDEIARRFEPPLTPDPDDAAAALIMASWYDERAAVELLLDRGVDVAARPRQDGQTALHVAAYQGNVPLTRLLLARGAPVNVTDEVHRTTPLVWALHAWLVDGRGEGAVYREVLEALLAEGAEVRAAWIDDDRLREDEALYAALSARAG